MPRTNRREFLAASGLCAAAALLRPADSLFGSTGSGWRTFEITTRVEVLKPFGTTRVWIPTALLSEARYQKTLSNTWQAEPGTARLIQTKNAGLGIVAAEFPAGVPPVLKLTSRVNTRDIAVDLASRHSSQESSPTELRHFLRPTKLVPTTGIVQETATQITAGAKTDLEKARAIYEWIVDNTFRNPKTRGCGTGDIRFMLESRDFGGKCADLNALYVGLARASGLPARDVYGIRVAPSALGYKSLGAGTDNITKAQHCRAEVYLSGYGWVPVDPADVRKVVLEEPPGNHSLTDEPVKAARARLFGSWEMNWIAYNFANDVELPGSPGKPLPFLMYPQAETAGGRLDCLDPENFEYTITSRQIS